MLSNPYFIRKNTPKSSGRDANSKIYNNNERERCTMIVLKMLNMFKSI
jgi:hypothetical protein